jgi:hypothetical protein
MASVGVMLCFILTALFINQSRVSKEKNDC